MRVLDPGHWYRLQELDGMRAEQSLVFVKRIGETYPGNVPPGHSGVTVQEVLRALINRLDYVDGQQRFEENSMARSHLVMALYQLEGRAARARDVDFLIPLEDIELRPVCRGCGHTFCRGCTRGPGVIRAVADLLDELAALQTIRKIRFVHEYPGQIGPIWWTIILG